MVKYLKENFFVRYCRFDSFALEQVHLQSSPDTDFDTSYSH